MSGPLTGVRVVDITINVLGPVSTQILGDMGADVIKVETPQGDPMREIGPMNCPGMGFLFMGVNRNKRSVTLDLKNPTGLETLMRLIETADVFVHSVRPGTAAKLGVSYEAISARNPGIVYAFAPGYRPDSSRRDDPAFDDVIQGESGIVSMIERANGEPRYVPMAIADKFCGHILASSIGMALFHRERTGEGQEVHVPMLDTMLSFNLMEHVWTDFVDPSAEAPGYARMFSPQRRPFATKDGYVCFLAVTNDQWQRMFAALERPEMMDDPRFRSLQLRAENITELYTIVADVLRQRPSAEWFERLSAAGIPNGPVNSLSALSEYPYLKETEFFRQYEHPTAGAAVMTAIPVEYTKSPGTLRMPPPSLGQHTEAILGELGLDETTIAAASGADTESP
ncbi:MAG: CoA transferase [Gammaproteobacteria bacterium]|jgi:crotonobetainyl-CoA:carnitine CoA-transferase CaiB-like acyl-CoA transferase